MTDFDRRAFITLVSGAGALLASCGLTGRTREASAGPTGGAAPAVPRRRFGNTAVTVSKLCLGGSSLVGAHRELLLDEALRHGIDCWEHTSFNDRAFGDYFRTHRGVRERVFLSAKTRSNNPATMQVDLERALAENETSAIDLFALHGVEDVAVLTDDVRRWAERAKQEGKIRFFGFCTHKAMSGCLDGAAELGWIDAVQAFYNYRMQAAGTMEAALRRAHEKGIAVFAVKSMGLCVTREADLAGVQFPEGRLRALLADHGLSLEQAKLRSIWQNPFLTSVCSLMPTPAILQANASAAMDERPLDREVAGRLAAYAGETGRYFCRRCGTCDTAGPDGIPIFQVMESLMYARGYGSRELAAMIFDRIPAEARGRLPRSDYASAERQCPQQMPIAQLMREAYLELNG